jgi:hypothetical protein
MAICYCKGVTPTEQGIKDIDNWLYQKYGDPINNYNGSVTNTSKLEAVIKEYGSLTNSYRVSGWGLSQLKAQIDDGHPVIAAVTAKYLSNRGYPFAGGHFVVVTGYTNSDIICNDPGTNSGAKKYYSNSDFSAAFSSQNGSAVVVVPNGGSSGKPDLVVKEVNLSKIDLAPGEPFHIDTRIKNQGDADADHSFKIKYLLSPGTTINNSSMLGTDSISSLDNGDSHWESIDVTAPQTPGTYNITVKADSSTDIDESHESNNYFNPPVVITVHVITVPISPAVLSIITNLIMAEDEKSEISVTPASLDFGDINVGATSTAQTITVENVGNADLKIGTLSTSSTEFVLQHDLCSGKTLAASANCTVDVIFKPASAEPKDEALSVPSNDTKTPVAEAGLLGYAVMPTPPLAPSNLTAKAISSTQIVLAWRDNADNEAGFKIERKTGSCASTTAWSHVATKTANSITFTNSGLIAGTAYSYRIRASNAGGASTSSNCATATTGKAGTPNAPAGLKATSVSAKKITLTWADKSTDETSFKVYRKDSGAWGLLTTLPANATAAVSYSDAAATGNTATTGYSYHVQACNESGCSPATTVAFAPFKPTTLSATASSGKIDLSWIDNSSNETGFQVYKKPGACTDTGTWSILTTTLANAESDSETAVTTGSTYSYKVRAFYKSTASPYSYGYSMFAPCFSLQAQ